MRFIQIMMLLLVLGISSTTIAQVSPFAPERGQRGYTPPPKYSGPQSPEKPDVMLLSQSRADFYEEELGIDAFEKEVLKTYLKNYYTETVAIEFDEKLKFEDKAERLVVHKVALETELQSFLNNEQVSFILDNERVGGTAKSAKKSKKKKKKKKKKKSKS